MAAILQIIKSPFLDEQLADFDEIWYMTAYLELNDSHVNKYDFFKIQDGGHPPYWKSFFLAITQQPIAQFQ